MQIQADSDPIRRFLCIILNDEAPSFLFLLLSVNTCQYCVTYCSRRLKHIKKINLYGKNIGYKYRYSK